MSDEMVKVGTDGGYSYDACIDTDVFIERTLGQDRELCDGLPDSYNDTHCRELRDRMDEFGYEFVAGGATCNNENDLSDDFIYAIYAKDSCSDWCWGEVIVAVQMGGYQGAYGDVRLFAVDSVADTGFLDWVVSWYVEREVTILPETRFATALTEWNDWTELSERASCGYSSNPGYEMRKTIDAEYAGCDDERGEWDDGVFYFCDEDGDYIGVRAVPYSYAGQG